MKLKDKVALVTGGGRGIGQAIAIAFAKEGADVIVAARSTDQLQETVQKDDDFWDTSVSLNLTAPYILSKAFLTRNRY